MQHLDEGTIHSWLDGALNADETARVEAHVAECPQCAAAVAEARGFIAASSRILTALDNAPRGVIPVAAPRKRVDPLVWRIAATVLVVAAGTLVVVQNREITEPLKGASENQTTLSSRPTEEAMPPRGSDAATAAAANAAVPKATELDGAAQRTAVGAAAGASPSATLSKAPTVASAEKAAVGTPRRGVTTGETKLSAEGISTAANQTAIASDYSGVPAPAAPTGAVSRLAPARMRDAAAEPSRLKVVGSPRQIGAKVTLYEVAPGDTVTLTESMPSLLSSIVVTGARTQMAPQAAGKSAVAPPTARADAATTTVPESQRAAGVSAAAPAVPTPAPSRTEMANALHTITWIDSATGNTLTLTGRMPEARLQEIRIRIERERGAAGRKNP
jgi:anti-sigma factor RsiW